MKTAFVHDRIFHIGGAESVFFEYIEKHTGQESMIFTLFSDKKQITIGSKSYHITTALPARINNMFVRGSKQGITVLDYRNLLVLYPALCRVLRRKIHTYNADKIFISSFAIVKNVIPPSDTDILGSKATLYLHSPNQYIWENYEEYSKKITGWKGRIFKRITPSLRRWDKQARHYDNIICNSEYTKQVAHNLYDTHTQEINTFSKATVVYPTIDPIFTSVSPAKNKKNYFVFVGRVTTFVREVDKIIHLFNTTGDQLIIVGSGPDEDYLKSIAGPTITFVGRIENRKEKVNIMKKARGFINLAKESCGIATMEARALGLPVFGYNAGGTVELVGPDQGLLIDHKDQKSIREGFEEFKEKFC